MLAVSPVLNSGHGAGSPRDPGGVARAAGRAACRSAGEALRAEGAAAAVRAVQPRQVRPIDPN
eukprot:SAG31_NODE_26085_length_448_cov_1.908309_1_plen_63_part_00